MGSRKQYSVNHFGPILRKPSIRKAPGKLKKKAAYNHANERGDYNVIKRPQQNNVATKKPPQFPFEEPRHAKAVTRQNIYSRSSWPNKGMTSPWENGEKSKACFSRALQKNTQKANPSRAMPNSGVDSLQKNTTKLRPSSFMSNNGNTSRPNISMGSPVKNVEPNIESPRSENKMHVSSYSRPNDEMLAPRSNCGFGPLTRTIEKSKPSSTRDQYSLVLKDDSNSIFGISKKSYPSSMLRNSWNEDRRMAMEASNSNLALKGKKVMEDIQPNLEINCVSLPGKNLPSHQMAEASCMVDSIDRCIQLDSRKCNTSLSKDGRTDVYKSNKSAKRMKSLLEEKFEVRGVARITKSMGISTKLNNKNSSLGEEERNVDEKFNKMKRTDNCSQTNKRRRYVVYDDEVDDDGDQNLTGAKSAAARLTTQKDCHLEVSNLFGLESSKPYQYSFQGKPYLWAVVKHIKDKVHIVEEEQHGKGHWLNMDARLEASEEAKMQDMEQEQNPTTTSLATSPTASPNAQSPTTSAPTSDATISANHG
ncbi:hypothetical protein VPH35_122857 [Triticum aestivum]